MGALKKTNAVRLLEGMKIAFELIEYKVGDEHLSAEEIARQTGIAPERTFKTLCCRADKTGVLLVCVPAPRELDLKALAASSGNKSAELVHLNEVLSLTGYVRGGCSPLGTKKKYPVIIDESAMSFDYITVNAGHRGLLFKLAPQDLVKATEAKVAPVSR